MKRLFSGIVVALLLINMLTLAFRIQPANTGPNSGDISLSKL